MENDDELSQEPHEAAGRGLQTKISAASAAAVLVLGGAVAAFGYQQGWFGDDEEITATPAPTATPSEEGSEESAEPTDEETEEPEVSVPREIERATWSEFRGDGQPIRVADMASRINSDPLAPYVQVGDKVYRVADGQVTTALDQGDTPILFNARAIRGGFVHVNIPTEGIIPGVWDAGTQTEVMSPEDFNVMNPDDWGLNYLVMVGPDTFFYWSQDFSGLEGLSPYSDEYAAADQVAPRAIHLTTLEGKDVWRKEDDRGLCRSLQHNGVSPWLVELTEGCHDLVNTQTGEVISLGKGRVIATYDDHVVSVDQQAGTFIAYDAQGNVEAEYAVPAGAVKMLSPIRLRNQNQFDADYILDYGLEVTYPDLIAGLEYLENAGVQTQPGPGGTSMVKWQILPGGVTMKIDASSGDSVTLTRSDNDQQWHLPCMNATVIAGGERALCQEGEGNGTLFNLEAGGATSPVWKIPEGVAIDAVMRPFNNTGWVLSSSAGVWVLPE
ncbi:MAG: hypothetical protein Q4Q03_05520 [Bowdeniella nasicola]|nr:hypothetical protein [Bowdeniella nasicola]